eukprot:tig00021312_g20062.t1
MLVTVDQMQRGGALDALPTETERRKALYRHAYELFAIWHERVSGTYAPWGAESGPDVVHLRLTGVQKSASLLWKESGCFRMFEKTFKRRPQGPRAPPAAQQLAELSSGGAATNSNSSLKRKRGANDVDGENRHRNDRDREQQEPAGRDGPPSASSLAFGDPSTNSRSARDDEPSRSDDQPSLCTRGDDRDAGSELEECMWPELIAPALPFPPSLRPPAPAAAQPQDAPAAPAAPTAAPLGPGPALGDLLQLLQAVQSFTRPGSGAGAGHAP